METQISNSEKEKNEIEKNVNFLKNKVDELTLLLEQNNINKMKNQDLQNNNKNDASNKVAFLIKTTSMRSNSGSNVSPKLKKTLSFKNTDNNNSNTNNTNENDTIEKNKYIAELEESNRVNIENLEQLEDQIYLLKQEYNKTIEEKNLLDADKNLIAHQLEALIKEKRTDVVKRFENEIEQLLSTQSELNEKIAVFTAEKVKSDSKIKELKDRAEAAEDELKDRDINEQKKLNPIEEKSVLKTQINKQRDVIILKSKAATAGCKRGRKTRRRSRPSLQKWFNRGAYETQRRYVSTQQRYRSQRNEDNGVACQHT
jgi:hypothetical protein